MQAHVNPSVFSTVCHATPVTKCTSKSTLPVLLYYKRTGKGAQPGRQLPMAVRVPEVAQNVPAVIIRTRLGAVARQAPVVRALKVGEELEEIPGEEGIILVVRQLTLLSTHQHQ